MKLFDYQQKAVDQALNYLTNENLPKQFNLFFEMGLGKTITAISILKKLIRAGSVNNILIICPKSLVGMWEYEIYKNFKDIQYNLVDLQVLNEWNNAPCFCVTNYEYFRFSNLKVLADLVIFDEVHKLKNIKSLTHKQISKNVKAGIRLNLTGTPITKDLMDLFGILTAIEKQEVNGLSATRFRAKYVINGGSYSKDKLMEYIKPFTIFADLEKYIDMPGYEDVIIPIELSKSKILQLARCYSDITSPLAKLTEAQCITSGFMPIKYYCDDKLVLDSNLKAEKCNELISDIIEDGNKVVLFCKYDNEFNYFMDKYAGICTGINGKTEDRDTPVYEFQNNLDVKIFVGNLQTASVGITLTAAQHCIFYSETFDWKDYEQAKARIYRIGQRKPCIYYHLLYKNSIDELIYNSNINKTNLIEDFKSRYEGERK